MVKNRITNIIINIYFNQDFSFYGNKICLHTVIFHNISDPSQFQQLTSATVIAFKLDFDGTRRANATIVTEELDRRAFSHSYEHNRDFFADKERKKRVYTPLLIERISRNVIFFSPKRYPMFVMRTTIRLDWWTPPLFVCLNQQYFWLMTLSRFEHQIFIRSESNILKLLSLIQ